MWGIMEEAEREGKKKVRSLGAGLRETGAPGTAGKVVRVGQ